TYGFAIAIFTAGVRSLLVPLSVQQSKSTEYNKALQPYILEINEKFKDNEQRKNQAVGKLYEDANQNPLSGCLLSLFQLPIFLGLYRGVRLLALDGVLDEKFLWIPSLQGPVTAASDYRGMDWLTQGWTQSVDSGIWTPSLGWETTLAFCVMPVLLVLGQKLTMTALSPPEVDDEREAKDQADTTKNVLKFLPLLIGFFSLQVPAALTIYWFTSNGFTLAQSLAVRKYYEANPPV
ncbi:60 kDa inner membrane insertion protein, partial [Fragilariopsis cylindrus CCMP1102]